MHSFIIKCSNVPEKFIELNEQSVTPEGMDRWILDKVLALGTEL